MSWDGDPDRGLPEPPAPGEWRVRFGEVGPYMTEAWVDIAGEATADRAAEAVAMMIRRLTLELSVRDLTAIGKVHIVVGVDRVMTGEPIT